jgi:hypothetical protein
MIGLAENGFAARSWSTDDHFIDPEKRMRVALV